MELQDPSGPRAVDQSRGTSSVDPNNDGDGGDLYNRVCNYARHLGPRYRTGELHLVEFGQLSTLPATPPRRLHITVENEDCKSWSDLTM